jgi:hypothetical protein
MVSPSEKSGPGETATLIGFNIRNGAPTSSAGSQMAANRRKGEQIRIIKACRNWDFIEAIWVLACGLVGLRNYDIHS